MAPRGEQEESPLGIVSFVKLARGEQEESPLRVVSFVKLECDEMDSIHEADLVR